MFYQQQSKIKIIIQLVDTKLPTKNNTHLRSNQEVYESVVEPNTPNQSIIFMKFLFLII